MGHGNADPQDGQGSELLPYLHVCKNNWSKSCYSKRVCFQKERKARIWKVAFFCSLLVVRTAL